MAFASTLFSRLRAIQKRSPNDDAFLPEAVPRKDCPHKDWTSNRVRQPVPTLDALIDSFDRHGYVVVPSVFPEEEIGIILDASVRFFDEAAKADAGQLPRAYLYNGGNHASSMLALEDYGAPQNLLISLVANSVLMGFLEHYRGDRVMCSLTHSRIRRSMPQKVRQCAPASTEAWHTDADPAVEYHGAMIVWVPFTPTFGDYPGIEVRDNNGQVVEPEMLPGDVVVFSDRQPHRTASAPNSTKSRYSCDVRFFDQSDVPDRVASKIAQGSLQSVRAFVRAEKSDD